MKNKHAIALVCFAVAGACYYFGLAPTGAAGLVLIGGLFEIVAWKKVLSRDKE